MFSAFSPNIYQSARETICCHLVLFGLTEILKLYTYMKMHLQIFAHNCLNIEMKQCVLSTYHDVHISPLSIHLYF